MHNASQMSAVFGNTKSDRICVCSIVFERLSAANKNYFTPHIFKVAALKRSNKVEQTQILSDFVFPKTADIWEALCILSQNSRQMLNRLAADLSSRILNYKNITSLNTPKIGDFVYVKDKIQRKHFTSLGDALAIVENVNGRTLRLKLAKSKTILRNVQDVIRFNSKN
jgi:hypothetical protein